MGPRPKSRLNSLLKDTPERYREVRHTFRESRFTKSMPYLLRTLCYQMRMTKLWLSLLLLSSINGIWAAPEYRFKDPVGSDVSTLAEIRAWDETQNREFAQSGELRVSGYYAWWFSRFVGMGVGVMVSGGATLVASLLGADITGLAPYAIIGGALIGVNRARKWDTSLTMRFLPESRKSFENICVTNSEVGEKLFYACHPKRNLNR